MWVYISAIAKTIAFPHKIKVGKPQNSNRTKYPQVIVENFVILPHKCENWPYTKARCTR